MTEIHHKNTLKAQAFCLPRDGEQGMKEARPEGAANADEPLEHSEPIKEVRSMSRCGHYTDSACADNTEQFDNWQSIGELAARLVRS